ncbi:MAG: flavin reductase [Ignavibacteria bacterium]|nr:MAG: flavin reductase [Ignavibacteria bacterium]
MKVIDPAEHPVPYVHRMLLGGVAPRPIALVASRDAEGRDNLSPFSFFNAFGANPPVVVVSPAYRGRDGSAKHTFENIRSAGEFTISAVSHPMVEQISLASSDYDRGVDEFVKAGFTKHASEIIAPPGVAESPFIMECRLLRHVDTGGRPGAGNLMIAEVLRFHISEEVFDGDVIDPRKLDLVARMGGNWYCRANGDALFELPKPAHNGIGFDALPGHLLHSRLTGNELALLAGVAELPPAAMAHDRWTAGLRDADTLPFPLPEDVTAAIHLWNDPETTAEELVHALLGCVRSCLSAGNLDLAWTCAWIADLETVSRLRADA